MDVPKLQFESATAKIGIQTTNATLDIKQPRAQLSIEQPSADVFMKTKKPILHIDQTEAWADAGSKSTERMIREAAEEGYRAFLQGTERRAMQGTELMRIEVEGNPAIDQAEQHAYKALQTIGLTYIPGPFAVRFDYEPGEVVSDITPKHPIIHAEIRQPELTFTPGDVSISLETYPSLSIDVAPLFFKRV